MMAILQFYTWGGLITLAVFLTMMLTFASHRFNDADILEDMMGDDEDDPIVSRLAEIFGSRLGLCVLIFLTWPISVYLLLQKIKKAIFK